MTANYVKLEEVDAFLLKQSIQQGKEFAFDETERLVQGQIDRPWHDPEREDHHRRSCSLDWRVPHRRGSKKLHFVSFSIGYFVRATIGYFVRSLIGYFVSSLISKKLHFVSFSIGYFVSSKATF